MSQNYKIQNISPGISIISYIDDIIKVTNKNNTIISKAVTNNTNYTAFYLSNFNVDTYKITVLQDISLNYALFGAGAPGDDQPVESTLVSGIQGAYTDTNTMWKNDSRVYNVSLNYGYGGANGALVNSILPCKQNTTITISKNTILQGLLLDYNNQTVTAGDATKTVSNNIIKGTGGLTTYSENWSYTKNFTNGTNKTDSYLNTTNNLVNSEFKRNVTLKYNPRSRTTGPVYDSVNIDLYGPKAISSFPVTMSGKITNYTAPCAINNANVFSTYGGSTTITKYNDYSITVTAPWPFDNVNSTFTCSSNTPSNYLPKINNRGTTGSEQFALIYYFQEPYYNLQNTDTKLYIDTTVININIKLISNNFSNGYLCEISNIGNPIHSIVISSDRQNILYNYDTILINSQSITLRNIKLIFNNSTWVCIAS